jgi:hypothetical protein
MLVYLDHGRTPDHWRNPEHTVVACPAKHMPAVSHASEWKDGQGEPVVFSVKFRDGVADVPDHLGKYLLDQGHVKKSRPLLRV